MTTNPFLAPHVTTAEGGQGSLLSLTSKRNWRNRISSKGLSKVRTQIHCRGPKMTCTFQFFYNDSTTLPNQWCCIIYISIQILNALRSSFYSWMIEKIYLAFQIIMQAQAEAGRYGRPTQFQTKESFEKDFDEWIKAEVCVNLRSITHNFGSAKLMNVSSIWVAVTWKGFGITSPFDNWRLFFSSSNFQASTLCM